MLVPLPGQTGDGAKSRLHEGLRLLAVGENDAPPLLGAAGIEDPGKRGGYRRLGSRNASTILILWEMVRIDSSVVRSHCSGMLRHRVQEGLMPPLGLRQRLRGQVGDDSDRGSAGGAERVELKPKVPARWHGLAHALGAPHLGGAQLPC